MNASQIKEQIGIVEYLRGIGIEPASITARGYMYRCPWRDDKHPSLSVTRDGRAWYDHSTGEKGSIIDLIMKIQHTNDLAQVCASFASSSFRQSIVFDKGKEKDQGEAFKSFDVVPLQSPGLFAYLKGRGIPSDVARMYCQEARYSFNSQEDGRYMYAVSFLNDKGGYELRSKYFKGCKSPKGITTYFDIENAPTVVFEGFIDFLSFVTMEGTRKHNYCVLNSITNAAEAIEKLSGCCKVYLCLDNDGPGQQTAAYIMANLSGDVEDISPRILPYKDLNDFLLKKASE
jgi:hypothetical protein